MRIEQGHGHRLQGQSDRLVRIPVRILILLGTLAMGLVIGCDPTAPKPKPTASDTLSISEESSTSTTDKTLAKPAVEQVVRVQIRRGIGTESSENTTAWSQGMTVFDALMGLSPDVAVESTGQGESLFVKSIAGQANLGSAGDNWIYRVNGKLGDRSCAVYELEAGDTVVWSFGKYE